MSYAQAIEQQMDMLRFLQGAHAFEDMYLSARVPDDSKEEELVEGFVKAAFTAITQAEPFYWDTTTCDLIQQTAPSMPDMTLRPEDMIVPFGFAWFSRPLTLPPFDLVHMEGKPVLISNDLPMLGFAWAVINGTGVFFMPFTPHPARAAGGPAQFVMWRFSDGFDALLSNVRETANMDANSFLGDERLRDIAAHRRMEQMRYVAACITFMNQRILVRHGERPPRATRKRLEREGWTHEQLIQVVTLRRSSEQEQPRERSGEPVEWSCQWVVRGHWRQQACGEGYSERRPVFVLPYVKGDPDKPLKAPAERVFAVVR